MIAASISLYLIHSGTPLYTSTLRSAKYGTLLNLYKVHERLKLHSDGRDIDKFKTVSLTSDLVYV